MRSAAAASNPMPLPPLLTQAIPPHALAPLAPSVPAAPPPRQLSYAFLPPSLGGEVDISILRWRNSPTNTPSAPTSTALAGKSRLFPAPILRDSFWPTPSALATYPSFRICQNTSFNSVVKFWLQTPPPRTSPPMTAAPTSHGCPARLLHHRRVRQAPPPLGVPQALLLFLKR